MKVHTQKYTHNLTDGNVVIGFGDLSRYARISVQVEWQGAEGELTGQAKLLQSNNGDGEFDEITELGFMIDSSDGSRTREHLFFAARQMAVSITTGGITAGAMTITVIAKS